ncbi:WbqC family protein [Methanoregula sp.]|jgi:WbqC-like protein family|uniref:WbqC family protein n=1 Tax=Methanoregula sp. TaxID=2052170 RepID=UPI003C22F210
MIASIHQPAYLPWLGYFDKISKSDVHIFFDDAQYSKNNLFNRNRIKTQIGELWLTVPVRYKSGRSIHETEIDNSGNWREKHWKTITCNYSKTLFFKEYAGIFEEIYSRDWKILSDLTIAMNETICEIMGIKTKFYRSSELKAEGMSNEKLINLCKTVGADVYLSGQGAKVYMKEDLFREHGITVEYQEFSYPRYPQAWGDFIPNLSVIDYLFNCGVEEKYV